MWREDKILEAVQPHRGLLRRPLEGLQLTLQPCRIARRLLRADERHHVPEDVEGKPFVRSLQQHDLIDSVHPLVFPAKLRNRSCEDGVMADNGGGDRRFWVQDFENRIVHLNGPKS